MIPVVFIHYGASDHLPIALQQARKFNNRVLLLRDAKTRQSAIADQDFIIKDVFDTAFAKLYQHLSRNHHEFELQCITRWFELRDLMRQENLEQCLYLDSDVLLFANADLEWQYYNQFDFTLCLGTTGHTSFWRYDTLNHFCRFVTKIYQDHDYNYTELERIFQEMLKQNLAGGVSDMLLLKMFKEQSGYKVGEMCEVAWGSTWDHNLNASDGFRTNGNGRKDIQFINGYPHAIRDTQDGEFHLVETIRFKSLHFQGQAKHLMSEFVPI